VALVNSTIDTLRKNLGYQTGQTEPGSSRLLRHPAWKQSGSIQPWSPHGAAATTALPASSRGVANECDIVESFLLPTADKPTE